MFGDKTAAKMSNHRRKMIVLDSSSRLNVYGFAS
jgi:hypothetical protein